MKLVDANVLVYAVNEDASDHDVSKNWLESSLARPESLLLPWLSLIAFLRVTTNRRLFENPLPVGEALDRVAEWLAVPNVVAPVPDVRHLHRVGELLAAAGGRGGNLVNDAHLAALAVQYGATIVTFDTDFALFPGVRWTRPQ